MFFLINIETVSILFSCQFLKFLFSNDFSFSLKSLVDRNDRNSLFVDVVLSSLGTVREIHLSFSLAEKQYSIVLQSSIGFQLSGKLSFSIPKNSDCFRPKSEIA